MDKKSNKRALPPFLMVRSGLLKDWWPILVLLCMFPIIPEVEILNYDWVIGGWTMAFLLATIYSAINSSIRESDMKFNIKVIQDELKKYLHDDKYVLDFSILDGNLARILTEYTVRHNPGIFDKLMKKPESVKNLYMRSYIISGYLKQHSEKAQQILDKFKQDDVCPKVYKKLQKYKKRLADFEKKQR